MSVPLKNFRPLWRRIPNRISPSLHHLFTVCRVTPRIVAASGSEYSAVLGMLLTSIMTRG